MPYTESMKYTFIFAFLISSTSYASLIPENPDIEFRSGVAQVKANARSLYSQDNDGGVRIINRRDKSFYMRATSTGVNEPRISFVKQNGQIGDQATYEIATRNLAPGGLLERTVECEPSAYRKDGSIRIWSGKKIQYDCYYASANTCRKLFSGLATHQADFNQCKNLAERFKEITGYSTNEEEGVRSYQRALAREMNRLNILIQNVPVLDKDQLEPALALDNIDEKQPNAVMFFHDLDQKVQLCMKHFPDTASQKAVRQIEKNNSKRADQ